MAIPRTETRISNPSTNAGIRDICAVFKNAFVDAGWSQTSDTGQVDPTTVTASGSTNTDVGYLVFKMNDSLAATVPFFIRIDLGNGSTTSRLRIGLTIGRGSDGAGAITGVTRARTNYENTSTSATAVSCFIAGASSWIALGLWAGTEASVNSFLLFIEREQTSAGADASTGFYTAVFFVGSSKRMQYIPASGSPIAESTDNNICAPIDATTGNDGSDKHVYPALFTKSNGGAYLPKARTHMGYFSGDFSAYTTATFSVYGANHTYMPLTTNRHTSGGRTGNAGLAIMMRYE